MNYILKRNYLIKPSSVITDAVFLCQKESKKLTPFCVNFSFESLFFYDNHLTHTGRECDLYKTFSFSNTYNCFFASAKQYFGFCPFNFSIPSLQKSVTRLYGKIAACENLLHGCMGNLQPAKICYMAAWEICSLQKSITWLHGAFARCEAILHSCLVLSHHATAFYTAVWRFRTVRSYFTRLHGGFAPCESILHSCLVLSHHAKAFYTTVYLFCSIRKLPARIFTQKNCSCYSFVHLFSCLLVLYYQIRNINKKV